MANELQNTRLGRAIDPAASVSGDDFTSRVIDKADFPGCDYLEIHGYLGSIAAGMTTLKVVESDTKSSDTALGGTPADVVAAEELPGSDDDNKQFVFGIDLRKPRKQFLQLQATAGAGNTFVTALVIGRRLNTSSPNAEHRGMLFAQYA